MLCIYCFSPLSYCSVVPTTDVDAPVIDYIVDDRTPYRRASRQAEPLPLSHISPTCLYLSIALGICCCYVTFLFQCMSPLVVLFLYPMQPDKYILYTAVNPAPC